MSGPQGPDQTQPWPGQDQPSSDPSHQPGVAATGPRPGSACVAATTSGLLAAAVPVVSATRATALCAAAAVPADRAVRPGSGYGQQAYPQYGQQPGQASTGSSPAITANTVSSRSVRPVSAVRLHRDPEGSKRSLALVGGIIGLVAALVVAVVAVLGFWKPGFFVTTKLDVSAAQSGVQQILTDESNGYGAKNVKDVKCNNGDSPTVKKGETFDCEVSIDGTKRQVTVTFQDNNGTYEVGRPK